MVEPPIAHLRRATRELHDTLERRVDVIGALVNVKTRHAMLQRYYDLHAPAEAALAPWLDSIDGLHFEARRRGPALERLLGTRAPHRSAAEDRGISPAIDSQSMALGFFYVLEGSTLGGRVMARELARRGADQELLAYLDPYGERTGAMWRTFVDVLNREVGGTFAEQIGGAVRGAIRGFQQADTCLCEERLAA
jgi:heme oxygenase